MVSKLFPPRMQRKETQHHIIIQAGVFVTRFCLLLAYRTCKAPSRRVHTIAPSNFWTPFSLTELFSTPKKQTFGGKQPSPTRDQNFHDPGTPGTKETIMLKTRMEMGSLPTARRESPVCQECFDQEKVHSPQSQHGSLTFSGLKSRSGGQTTQITCRLSQKQDCRP